MNQGDLVVTPSGRLYTYRATTERGHHLDAVRLSVATRERLGLLSYRPSMRANVARSVEVVAPFALVMASFMIDRAVIARRAGLAHGGHVARALRWLDRFDGPRTDATYRAVSRSVVEVA